jgi:hypothetical protein
LASSIGTAVNPEAEQPITDLAGHAAHELRRVIEHLGRSIASAIASRSEALPTPDSRG